jgi:diguanylate cyclase (GGDEF)-like protein
VELRRLVGGAMVGEPAGAGPRPAPVGRWWARPEGRVGLLTGLMGAVTAGSALALVPDAPGPPGPGDWWWAGALALAFGLTDGFAVHVRTRRGAHALGLSEIPTVLGMLSLTPVLVVAARLAGGIAGLTGLRHQRGMKLWFNLGLVGVQAGVALLVFHAIAPHGMGRGLHELGARDWLATYAAMVSTDLVAVVLVTAVIAVHDDPGEWRRLPAAMRSIWVSAVTTAVGLIGFAAAREARWALALMAILGVVLYLAYRAYVQLGDGNAEVEQLYGFTRALDGAREIDDLVAVVLDRCRDLLRTAAAELVVQEDGRLRHTRLAGQAGAVASGLGGDADDAWLRPVLAGDPVLRPEAMAVPVALGDERAALVVTEGLPDSGPFTDARLRLFQALANHASAALGRAVLVDRLRREAADKLHLSLHDSLSGLPNRRYFQQLLDAELATARAEGSGVAVVLLDLDRFKEINDALGHETGDALLREVGERLRVHLDGRGVVARLGGDEFAVLLATPRTTAAAVAAARTLGAVVERSVLLGPLTLSARASIGVAAAPLHGDDAQTLIRHADVAMYAAKENRSGVRLYDPAVDVNSPQRLALIADLRVAVESRDLLVAYQPKVEPRTGEVVGAEALARWNHPVRGTVPPDEFIPLAEHSGLVRPLTLHVIELALRRRASWARNGYDLGVAVNLSPNSLLDAELPEVVARLLAQTGNAPSVLTLEITESTILADPAGSTATIERLHALGVKLSIDDFGTGYSSLGRLRELPIHEVKIDRSFVKRMAADHRDRAVVRSAVQLGHALDLLVVAEGVEDEATYAYLSREGCDVVQGYLLARPLPPDEFEEWLARRSPVPTHTFG